MPRHRVRGSADHPSRMSTRPTPVMYAWTAMSDAGGHEAARGRSSPGPSHSSGSARSTSIRRPFGTMARSTAQLALREDAQFDTGRVAICHAQRRAAHVSIAATASRGESRPGDPASRPNGGRRHRMPRGRSGCPIASGSRSRAAFGATRTCRAIVEQPQPHADGARKPPSVLRRPWPPVRHRAGHPAPRTRIGGLGGSGRLEAHARPRVDRVPAGRARRRKRRRHCGGRSRRRCGMRVRMRVVLPSPEFVSRRLPLRGGELRRRAPCEGQEVTYSG